MRSLASRDYGVVGASFYPIAFGNIVARAEQLDILGDDRCPPSRVRKDMVEVQLIWCAADHALTTVSLPDLQFHRSGDEASPDRVGSHRRSEVFLAFDGHELELENLSALALVSPGVNKMENPVVRPNPLLQFFIDPDTFRWSKTTTRLLSSLVEKAILRESPR